MPTVSFSLLQKRMSLVDSQSVIYLLLTSHRLIKRYLKWCWLRFYDGKRFYLFVNFLICSRWNYILAFVVFVLLLLIQLVNISWKYYVYVKRVFSNNFYHRHNYAISRPNPPYMVGLLLVIFISCDIWMI